MLDSEIIKFLKNLHADFYIIMHQMVMNILKNILTKIFFSKEYLFNFYIWKLYFVVDFCVKLIRSYLSILKQFVKNFFFYSDLWKIKRFSWFYSLFGRYFLNYLWIRYLKSTCILLGVITKHYPHFNHYSLSAVRLT